MVKYVLITGGVISGIGKGVIASSLGALLQRCNHNVTAVKIDPYINLDAGTMSPIEHGEVYVLADGGEVDLDLGNYERFMGLELGHDNNITTGKVYKRVIDRERKGGYLGKTVQVIPHITDEIKEWIYQVANTNTDPERDDDPEFCVIELGGTIGDIESLPFVEALRQLRHEHTDDFINIHVSLVPVVGSVGEQKTKPTQESVKTLRSLGLEPDIIVCRSTSELASGLIDKIKLMCGIKTVVSMPDVDDIYKVPVLLEQANILQSISDKLTIHCNLGSKWQEWLDLLDKQMDSTVRIGVIGKYVELKDSYLSLIRAIQHACIYCGCKLDLVWISSEELESLDEIDGMIIPGGFGERGTEGKINALRFARENGIPTLGICLGLQLMVVEFARNVAKLSGANSEEFDSSAEHQVVMYVPSVSRTQMGGTMRLGAQDAIISDNSQTAKLYKTKFISERHRHRYEVNREYISVLQKAGLQFVGFDCQDGLAEVIELPKEKHPFYIGIQAHPEFKTTHWSPSPLFIGLIRAVKQKLLDQE